MLCLLYEKWMTFICNLFEFEYNVYYLNCCTFFLYFVNAWKTFIGKWPFILISKRKQTSNVISTFQKFIKRKDKVFIVLYYVDFFCSFSFYSFFFVANSVFVTKALKRKCCLVILVFWWYYIFIPYHFDRLDNCSIKVFCWYSIGRLTIFVHRTIKS